MTGILPKRAKLARMEKKMGVSEAAKKLGIARSTLWKYERGERTPDIEVARKMAHIYDVPLDWLVGTAEQKTPPALYLSASTNEKVTTVAIPLLGTIPAGLFTQVHEKIISFIDAPQNLVKDGDYFYLQVGGDEMMGSGIQKGDFILVKMQPTVERGEIAVVRTKDEEGTLKRIKTVDDKYILYPDNNQYEPQLENCKDVQIIGKVIKVEFDPNSRRRNYLRQVEGLDQ